MNEFNPNDIGIANGNFFGLPENDPDLVLVSAPWDATVSYGKGTADGPQSILDASLQVDLFDEKIPEVWKMKVATHPISAEMHALSDRCRKVAESVIFRLEEGESEESLSALTRQVDEGSRQLNRYVEEVSSSYLEMGKTVGLIGGEHSVTFGLVKALSRRHENFGILHIDAHSDTREAYEGFQYSHASIMYNVLKEIPQVSRIAQVGIRDYCSAEHALVTRSPRVSLFSDFDLKCRLYEGKTWQAWCDEIIASLPEKVYISFDIDGLTPEYCPNTGTPVPGGLTFSEADYLLYRLSRSRTVIGFDLCEVAPGKEGEWDANVGARILFKMLVYTFSNRKK